MTTQVTIGVNENRALTEALHSYLATYPQDAAYHNIELDKNGRPNQADVERAAANGTMVEMTRAEF